MDDLYPRLINTCDISGISNQIKVLLILSCCAFCLIFLQRTFMQTRCVCYSVNGLRCLRQMRSIIQLFETESCGGGLFYIFRKQKLCVCLWYAFLPPASTGVAACRVECVAVGPPSLCALWLEGAGSQWLNPAVAKALGGGPSICFAKIICRADSGEESEQSILKRHFYNAWSMCRSFSSTGQRLMKTWGRLSRKGA